MTAGKPQFPLTDDAMAIFSGIIIMVCLAIAWTARPDKEVHLENNPLDNQVLADGFQKPPVPPALSEEEKSPGVCRQPGLADAGSGQKNHRTPPDGPAERSRADAGGSTMEAAGPARILAILDAIAQVEGFRGKAGDGGRSSGPYQIGRAYWADSGIGLPYLPNVDDGKICRKVIVRYWRRYCPAALAAGDVRTLAAVHNAGPIGIHRTDSDYARRVENLFNELQERKEERWKIVAAK